MWDRCDDIDGYLYYRTDRKRGIDLFREGFKQNHQGASGMALICPGVQEMNDVGKSTHFFSPIL